MKLRIASDLHLEFFGDPVDVLERHFLPADERDQDSVLVLAGDISSNIEQLGGFIERVARRFEHVIYVPGNHEYYRSDYNEWNLEAESALEDIPRLQAVIGRASSRQFRGLRFVCATLWGHGGDTPDEATAIGGYLNDFRLITANGHPFTVPFMRGLHHFQREDIRLQLVGEVTIPTVVVTHHMPSYTLSHPRFGDVATGGFAGKCDDLMHGEHAPALWIHGHTHDTIDRVIGKTRVVCNPAGYMPEWRTKFNDYFAAPKFVEVAA